MATLGDFLSQILTEITRARSQADQEAVRLAHLYAGHELLKLLPVPHFRLPEVTMDIPVFIQSVGKPDALALTDLATLMEAAFVEVARAEFERAGQSLTEAELKGLRKAIRPVKEALARGKGAPHPGEVARHMLSRGSQAVRKPAPAASAEAEQRQQDDPAPEAPSPWDEVEERAPTALARVLPAPPAMHIVATTSSVRDVQRPEALLRIRLTVKEQNLEWSVPEDESAGPARLVHE